MTKKVFVNFYAAKNFGDDAFVCLLAQRYRNVNFIIAGQRNKLKAFKSNQNIKIHSISIFQRILIKLDDKLLNNGDFIYKQMVRNVNYVVTIGGSIFIEPDHKYIEKYLAMKKNLFVPDKRNLILGANFGPYQDDFFYDFFKKEFKKYDYISFRDHESYNLFCELNNVHYAPDILFGIKKLDVKGIEEPKKGYVILQVIEKTQNMEEYIAKNLEVIKYYNSKNLEVILMSLCENEGDLNVAKKIAKNSKSKIKIINYDGNIAEILTYIKNADYLIGARFHSIVMSLVYGIPCLPISYSNKTDNLLKDINFEGLKVKINDFARLTVEEIDRNRVNKYVVNVEKQVKNSEKHFTYLNKLLLGE